MNMPSAELSHANSDSSVGMMGADILVNTLTAEGVELVWGYPGGTVLYIYDAFYKQNRIERIPVHYERAVVRAVDGYVCATSKVGIALVTFGPGVANAVTSIATAYLDLIPMVIIINSVSTHVIGQNVFQECDTVGTTRPIVKHNFLIKGVCDLASTIRKVFYIAATGRPGLVVVDIPKNISCELCKYEYPKTAKMRSYSPVSKGHSGQIRKAVSLLLQAERPYTYSDGRVVFAEASEELRQLAVLAGYPVTNTLMGLGAFPGTSKQFVGILGMYGTYEANMAMQNCDALIAIGARFDDHVIDNPAHFISQSRKIIHIDIDLSSISKWVKVDVPIVGNVKDVLQEIVAQIQSSETKPNKTALVKWQEQAEQWRSVDCLKYDRISEVTKPQYVVEKIWGLTCGDAFICSDVGQHQAWMAQFYKLNEPRRWINSGGLDTMGVDLPYAMGIEKAFPSKEVVTITGEGLIQMRIQELLTCLQYDTPVKICSLNNGYPEMVHQRQEIEYDNRYSHPHTQVLSDFVKLAESYGHADMRIEEMSDVESTLCEAFRLEDHTMSLNFRTDPTENIQPIVQADKDISGMLLGVESL